MLLTDKAYFNHCLAPITYLILWYPEQFQKQLTPMLWSHTKQIATLHFSQYPHNWHGYFTCMFCNPNITCCHSLKQERDLRFWEWDWGLSQETKGPVLRLKGETKSEKSQSNDCFLQAKTLFAKNWNWQS